MIVYEVIAVVGPQLIDSFERYMRDEHIPDVLATGYFAAATFCRSGNRYQIRYEAETAEVLDSYLAEHTERLRAEVKSHFPDGIEFSREVWTEIATLTHS